MDDKKINVEIDVTKFINIDDKPYDIYINGKLARHLEKGEEQVIPIWVAKVGAEHLVDRVLQEKHNIKDTKHNSPLRQDLFAQILPEFKEELKIKPLSDEEFREELRKEQVRQSALIEELSGRAKEKEAESKKIEELEKEVASLKDKLEEKEPTSKGRKNK